MTRILLSLLTIAAVVGLSTAATLAYFTDNATLAENVTESGNATVLARITDTAGALSTLSTNGSKLHPGQSYTKCLWIMNNGTVASRYKLYRSGETGSVALGDKLSLSATINPTSGNCSGDVPSSILGLLSVTGGWTKASISGTRSAWDGVAVRGSAFSALASTPFTLLTSDDAINPLSYVVYALSVKLDGKADSTLENTSYTSELTVHAMQKEGSDPGITDWNP